jgi:hypothetical protein
MRFLRVVLALLLVVALGSAFAAAQTAVAANPACLQDLADHHRDCGGDVSSTSCSPTGCMPSAIAGAPELSCARPQVGCLMIAAATPMSSLALAPETAPPKHSSL